MAKLDFFTIHVETENDWVGIDIELNFICEDHTTVIECGGVADDTDLSRLLVCLKSLFEEETDCTYDVKQYLGGFKHLVTVYGGENDPSFAFQCDAIKITEHD